MTEQNQQQKAETKEIDIHGIKVSVPLADAEKIISGRDNDKAKIREYQEKFGKLEADAAASLAKANKAEEDRLAIEHAKKGEVEQVRELMTREAKVREAKLSAKARDKHLAALVAGNDGVIKSAVPDIVEALRGRTQYNFDTESVTVLTEAGQPMLGDDGKPMEVDAFLGKWLEKRPHYTLDKSPKGSGGSGAKNQTGTVISETQFESMTPTQRAVFFKDGGKVTGPN
ncbi:MAG: hypothetical protein WC069_06535 [Candidatus Shapirobacteria bacterium]